MGVSTCAIGRMIFRQERDTEVDIIDRGYGRFGGEISKVDGTCIVGFL